MAIDQARAAEGQYQREIVRAEDKKPPLTNCERSYICRAKQKAKRAGLPFNRADALILYRRKHGTAP